MKVAVLSESPADEAAVRLLVDAVLGVTTEPVAGPPMRTRGWPAVRSMAAKALKHLHYQTDADGLVVVVDSNGSPHRQPPDQPCSDDKCRLCLLRREMVEAYQQLRPVSGRETTIRYAVGVAVPAMEGWYRCGHDSTITEAAWIDGLNTNHLPFDKRQLKRDVYGTDRPSLLWETQCAQNEARRLAADLQVLLQGFPIGLGALVQDLNGWQAGPTLC